MRRTRGGWPLAEVYLRAWIEVGTPHSAVSAAPSSRNGGDVCTMASPQGCIPSCVPRSNLLDDAPGAWTAPRFVGGPCESPHIRHFLGDVPSPQGANELILTAIPWIGENDVESVGHGVALLIVAPAEADSVVGVHRGRTGALRRNKNSGAVAQLGERLVCNQKVVGSSPIGSSVVQASNPCFPLRKAGSLKAGAVLRQALACAYRKRHSGETGRARSNAPAPPAPTCRPQPHRRVHYPPTLFVDKSCRFAVRPKPTGRWRSVQMNRKRPASG
jgi:hypothetical protein